MINELFTLNKIGRREMISNKILLMIISVLILIMGILEAATDNLLGDYRMYHGILLIIIAIVVIAIAYMSKE